ncbi:hypothetical protein [uncultured Helicobacter sp.]|uniref:tetratricopeptide repeat protein n=1 Tax=uncultured Helicobacter sp. TaxID=175537 RepID=UPI002617C92D|nr:hypothetical protein [uncultured Helicobacter sp.]
MRNLSIFALTILLANTLAHAAPSQAPQWAESGICQEHDCAVGQASKEEGQMSALAHALQNLRLSLSSNVQAEYNEKTTDGKSSADSRVKIYAGMHNIGYKILDRYEDKKHIYIKIQYDPNKKLANDDPAPEFRELENLEKLCDDTTLNGYYCVGLGNKYHKGELELAPNPKLALKYYKKACSLGTLEGCVLAGQIIESSDSPKGAQWYFSNACENGYGLGCFKQAGNENLARKKLELYTRGCALGDDRSCAYLGEVYALGLANLRANPAKAHELYERANAQNPYGDAAVLALLDSAPSLDIAKDATRMDKKALRDLCEHNNARACAYLGQLSNSNDLLQKSAMLDSALGYYLLSLRESTHQTRIDMLTHSCRLGLASDFTKGCEALGDELLSSDKPAAQGYYQASCGHLFYEKSACQKLYDIDPKLCNNESVCLSFGALDSTDDLVADVASASIAGATSAVAVSNAVDAVIDGKSGVNMPAPKPRDSIPESASQDSPDSANLNPIATESTPKMSWGNHVPGIFQAREPKHVRLIGEIALGAHSMDYPQIRDMHKYLEHDEFFFMGNAKLGLEISTAKPTFSLFVAPYVQLSYAQLFDAGDFASKQKSEKDDDEKDEGNVSALMFGAGLQAGFQYKIWHLYAIADYGVNFSRISNGVSVPLRDMFGIGVGTGVELSFLRLGMQYIHNFYSYNTGSIYPNRGGANLVLDSASVRSSGGVFLLTIGFGF